MHSDLDLRSVIEGPNHGREADEPRGRIPLRRSEAKAQIGDLLDTVPVGLWLSDSDGRCTYVNAYWCAVLRCGAQDLLGAGWARFVHAKDRQRVHQAWTRATQTRTSYADEFRFVTPDGGYVWVVARANPIGSGGYIGSIVDVSEQKAIEADLRQAQKMKAVGELAGGVAHDFSSLLTAIVSGLQLGQAGVAENSPAAGALRTAYDAAQRAGKLTQQLLSLSRKRLAGECESVDLNTAIEQTADLLQHAIPRHTQMELVLDDRAPTVRIDEAQLVQALLNLGLNAKDAMPDGGVIQLATSVEHISSPKRGDGGLFARITVTDTGEGMPRDVMAQAFDPFFTTKDEGAGTGLGLPLVYRCAEEHGGWITLASRIGSGTTASLFLPCVASHPPIVSSDIPTGHETILIVDDVESVLLHTREILERIGYRVLAVPAAGEAMDRFLRHRRSIDAVVTDLIMPELTGRDLLHRLRATGSNIPVVLMTGNADDQHREQIVAEGFADLVAKPFRIDTLAQTVRRVLDDHRGPR